MPELPEVETIKKGLNDRIIGKTITDVDVEAPKSFIGKLEDIIGAEVIDVQRRAKLIRIKLSNSLNLLFHLKLTGQLIYRSPRYMPKGSVSSNTRIVFSFNDKSKLFFNDMRKFGWCKVLKDDAVEAIYQKDYGLEPLDSGFTVDYLRVHAEKYSKRHIKQFLMDQTIAAGMGNIYTDEALFEAKISPLRKVRDISVSQWQDIIQSAQKVLKLGIKHGGTTDSDYVNIDGQKGGMQNYLKVYHRAGKSCPNNCGGVVKRMTIGSRGTHFCPQCQK